MSSVLSQDAIKKLLGEDRKTPPQVGPIRFFDVEMRCSSRGCSSPTYIRLKGMPRCMMHTIRLANELLVESGIDS